MTTLDQESGERSVLNSSFVSSILYKQSSVKLNFILNSLKIIEETNGDIIYISVLHYLI